MKIGRKIRKLWMGMACLAVLMLCSCGNKKTEDIDMDESRIEEFQRLMDEYQAGDKKTVYWDGQNAGTKEDVLDDEQLEDGRGSGPYVEISNEAWSVKVPDQFEDECSVISDQPESYRMEGESWVFTVERMGYEDALAGLEEEAWLTDVTESSLGPAVKRKNAKAALYRGIRRDGERFLAGYALAAEDYFGNSYCISYFGIGNMNEITMRAKGIFKTFETELE